MSVCLQLKQNGDANRMKSQVKKKNSEYAIFAILDIFIQKGDCHK